MVNSKSNVVSFRKKEYGEYTHIHFRCGILTPEVLKTLRPPQVDHTKGVLLSGRGPIWLYGFLVHYYHPSKFVMVYEPRGDVGVVVQSHTPDYYVGDSVYIGKRMTKEMIQWEAEANRQ